MSPASGDPDDDAGGGHQGGRVIVAGGGLAGLTCALDLAEAGVPTTLVEKRPFVGGKTFSFRDPAGGEELDNGQHVFMRCCTAYLALIDRLGLREATYLQSRLRVPVLDPETGRTSPIASARGLPAPLNLAPSILRFAHLRWSEKLRLGRAVLPLQRMSEDQRRGLDSQSFGHWLRAHGQSTRVIERFWDLIVLPTCNDVSDDVSAAQAAYVFRTGLLDDPHGADIGVARVGLSHIADAALAHFREAGGEVRLARSLRSLCHDGERVSGVEIGAGEAISAEAVVLALPPNRAHGALPHGWRDRPGFDALALFQYRPIVNIHLHWDRTVLDEDFIAVLDPDVQYVFNRSHIQGLSGSGQWIDVSLSGAHDQAGRSQDMIAQAAIEGLRRALPPARDAEVLRRRVVKEVEATFRPVPGVAALRPGPSTPVANLFLAGAWTDTQWPATMESAVRSGHAAAAAVRARLRS